MKLGNWIHISAILVAGISSGQILASSNQNKISLSEEEFLNAIKKIQSKDKPEYKQGAPCYSCPDQEK